MVRLTTLQNVAMVEELMRRLEEASIQASCIDEQTWLGIYGGGPTPVAVWLDDADDLSRAKQILVQVQTQTTFDRCPGCRYDLRGHAGASACPECGRQLTAPDTDIECSNCGESVPATFEVCWSCGAGMSSSHETRE